MSRHLAAITRRMVQLETGAMYTVDGILISCPTCGEHITCRVEGTDVYIDVPCALKCSQSPNFDRVRFIDSAVAQAGRERRERAEGEYDAA